MTNNSAQADTSLEEQLAATVERLKRNLALLQDRIALLEQENTAFAGMLKERGVDVRASSQIAMELPQPISRPLAGDDRIFSLLTPAQRSLLAEIIDREPVFMLLKSETTTDTGGWFFPGEIWICALARELLLFASGRKPFIQKTPYDQLRSSLYNHVTGEVALAPSRGLKRHVLKVPPLDGYQLLAQIYNQP